MSGLGGDLSWSCSKYGSERQLVLQETTNQVGSAIVGFRVDV